jgi:hypothetical protein
VAHVHCHHHDWQGTLAAGLGNPLDRKQMKIGCDCSTLWTWLRRKTAPWMVAVGLLVAVAVVVSPWGNYPLNDDWQYARAAKIFSSTGHIEIDTPIAPSLVGQLVLAWPFIKVFGFSHTLLRLLTMTMAALLLWATDALLVLGEIPRSLRTKALALLTLNPLFVNLAFSFMTECYGYALALVGAVLWLRSRRAADKKKAPAAVTLGASVVAGTLIGFTFWIRQYCVVAYPALVGATILHLIAKREWMRLWRSLGRIAVGLTAFAAASASYMAWAKHYGLLKEAFSGRWGQLMHFDLLDYQITIGLQLVYIGGAFLPLFAMWPLRRQQPLRILGACAIALGFGLASYSLIQLTTSGDAGSLNLHRLFPFSSNIVHPRGVGPNTLTDMFFFNRDYYAILSRPFWRFVTYALLGVTALWGLPLTALRRVKGTERAGREVAAFAAMFSILSLAAVVQAMGRTGFDRYYLPILFGAAICVAFLLNTEQQAVSPLRKQAGSMVAFLVLTLPLAFFTCAGVHDYFRWNDARWRLVERARQQGMPTTSIDGGYEVNGWLSFDLMRKHPTEIDTNHCIGICHCEIPWGLASIWTCYDDSYRVGMSLRNGYIEIDRDEPRFWLGKNQPVLLSRRPGHVSP